MNNTLYCTTCNVGGCLMINKTEFVTEIYVDNDNDAMVAEFAFTEKASVDTAIASFNEWVLMLVL